MALRHVLIVAIAIAAPLCGAAEESALAMQQRIKAAFLYKFASYVQWPGNAFPEPASPIVIGVVGADPIAHELEQAVVGRSVGGRPLEIRRPARPEAAKDCCHILFVGSGVEPERTAQWLANAQGRPVLTVTETNADLPAGSVINFLAVDERVRFDISRDAAERNNLQLRSQLLQVARHVASP